MADVPPQRWLESAPNASKAGSTRSSPGGTGRPDATAAIDERREIVTVRAADGSIAECHVPFPPLAGRSRGSGAELAAHAAPTGRSRSCWSGSAGTPPACSAARSRGSWRPRWAAGWCTAEAPRAAPRSTGSPGAGRSRRARHWRLPRTARSRCSGRSAGSWTRWCWAATSESMAALRDDARLRPYFDIAVDQVPDGARPPAGGASGHARGCSGRCGSGCPSTVTKKAVAVRAECCNNASMSSTRSTFKIGPVGTIEIDHASLVPLHEQVAAAIRRAIAEGEAAAGERAAAGQGSGCGSRCQRQYGFPGPAYPQGRGCCRVPPRPRRHCERHRTAAQRGCPEGTRACRTGPALRLPARGACRGNHAGLAAGGRSVSVEVVPPPSSPGAESEALIREARRRQRRRRLVVCAAATIVLAGSLGSYAVLAGPGGPPTAGPPRIITAGRRQPMSPDRQRRRLFREASIRRCSCGR